jgi:hypothetical protein
VPLAIILALCAAASLDGGPGPEAAADASAVRLGLGLEVAAQALPSAADFGSPDGYLALHPLLSLRAADVFALRLGALVRLRLLDGAPAEAGGLLRAADWDELSDFGQLLELLSLGREAGPVTLRAGPVREKTLGFGHLVARYSNQDNLDYHPTAATLALAVGPVRAELFASDVLGARLFAAEVAWDLGATFSPRAEVQDRYLLALEVAHDAARAGLPTRLVPGEARAHPAPVTLLQLDASAVLLRLEAVRLTALLGAGARVDRGFGPGFLVGAAVDTRLGPVGLSAKLEGRSQAGGFRQGYFGPSYELSRFADTGLSGPPRAQSLLLPGLSGALELRLGVGTAFSFAATGEYFSSGRADLSASAAVALWRQALTAEARWSLVGLGVLPRTEVSLALRVRLLPSLYLLAEGGTAFAPRTDGTLARGVLASLGAGVDLETGPARPGR